MPFTKQELTYLHLLARRFKRAEILKKLNIASSTLNQHRNNIKMKLKNTRITINDLKGLSPELLEDWIKELEADSANKPTTRF